MAKQKKTAKTLAEIEYNKELKRIQQFIRRASKRGYIWEDSVIPKRPKKVTQKSVERLKKLTPNVLYKKGAYIDNDTGELLPSATGRHIERKQATEKAKQTRKAKAKTGDVDVPNKVPSIPEKPKTGNKKSKTNKTKQPKKPKTTPSAKGVQGKLPPVNDEPEDDYIDDQDEYYPEFTDVVISNFIATLNQYPNAEGTQLLLRWLDRLIADNGRGAVAQMLQDGAEAGLIITWETVYKSTNTKTYMTEMLSYLPDQGKFYADQIMDMVEQDEWWEYPE